MSSVKIKFRPSSRPDHEGTLYYQIIHDRKPRQILTKYHIYPQEWDAARSTVLVPPKSSRQPLLQSIRERIRWDLDRINKIIRIFHNKETPYHSDDIVNEFNRYVTEYSLFNFMQSTILSLKAMGKERTAETYQTTLNNFKKFRGNNDLMLDSIDSKIIEEYESWQKSNGISQNTVSFYNRILRAVYNRAVEDDIIENRHPFRHVYTGIDKTRKRALPLSSIKKIKALDLSVCPSEAFARDMFLLSFMLRGMSFIDMAFVKKSDLFNGHINYRRRKTGQFLSIEWTKEMQALIDKYPENKTPYLFPIITKNGLNERCVYKNIGCKINKSLKKVADRLNLEISLSMYVARHSWASIARAKGIPISIISEGLGHDSELTTQIYLASLDTSVIDKANRQLLTLL